MLRSRARTRTAAGPGAAGAAGSGSAGANASLSPAARQRLRARNERRIRRAVEQLSGCFYALSRLQRRVLALRGGLGERPAMSRAAVAAELRTSRVRVRRAERRGLRRLRRAERSDNCAGHGGPARTGAAVAAAARPLLVAVAAEPGGPSVFGTSVADIPRQSVRGAHASSKSPDADGGRRAERPERSSLSLPEEEPQGSHGPLIALLLSALGLILLFAHWRRSP